MATSTNVAVGKPAIAGAVYCALLSSNPTLPTDADTAVAEVFKPLGYVSEDGMTNNNSTTTSEIKAWGGDTVFTPVPGKTDTFKFKLIEALNAEVLKVIYGDANVTGTVDTGATVNVTTEDYADRAWVFDMVLRGVKKRIVVPNAKITALGEIVYNDSSAVGYDITITAAPNSGGVTHYEYLKKQA